MQDPGVHSGTRPLLHGDPEAGTFGDARQLLGGDLQPPSPILERLTWFRIFTIFLLFLTCRLIEVDQLAALGATFELTILAPFLIIAPTLYQVNRGTKNTRFAVILAVVLGVFVAFGKAHMSDLKGVLDILRGFFGLLLDLPTALVKSIIAHHWPPPEPPGLPPWRKGLFCVLIWVFVLNSLTRLVLSRFRPRWGPTTKELGKQAAAFFALLFVTSEAGLQTPKFIFDVLFAFPQVLLALTQDTMWPEIDALFSAIVIFPLLLLKCVILLREKALLKRQMSVTSRDIAARLAYVKAHPYHAHLDLCDLHDRTWETFKQSFASFMPSKGDEVETKRKILIAACRRELPDTLLSELPISVRREEILADSLAFLGSQPTLALLAEKLKVAFEDEPGVDEGGVQRDWFNSLGEAITQQARDGVGNMCYATDGSLCPRPGDMRIQELFAMGRLFALAIWHSIPMPVSLNGVFCKAVLGVSINIQDLRKIDPDFYKHRVATVLRPGGAQAMEQILGEPLYFMSAATPLRSSRKLLNDGETKAVTEENKQEYVALLCEHYMCAGMREQIGAFLAGFWDVIPQNALHDAGLHYRELAMMIVGLDSLDVESWKKSARTDGDARLLRWFWAVVESLNMEERAKLLHFCTGSSRLPPGGFDSLEPRFKVAIVETEDPEYLPHAHTCFNLLIVPHYASQQELKDKLLVALANDSGFGFA